MGELICWLSRLTKAIADAMTTWQMFNTGQFQEIHLPWRLCGDRLIVSLRLEKAILVSPFELHSKLKSVELK